jgi:hypothetical protein
VDPRAGLDAEAIRKTPISIDLRKSFALEFNCTVITAISPVFKYCCPFQNTKDEDITYKTVILNLPTALEKERTVCRKFVI